MDFKVGDTHNISIGPGELRKIHVLAVVDGNHVVYKWYGKHKQWWHYAVERDDILEIWIARAKQHNKI